MNLETGDILLKNSVLSSSVQKYQLYNSDILLLEFVTVSEYLDLIETISKQINALQMQSITYLAAAVSDFYLPDEEVSLQFYMPHIVGRAQNPIKRVKLPGTKTGPSP